MTRTTTARILVALLNAAILPWLLAAPAAGAGGVVKLKTQGFCSGYYYNALGNAAARYVAKYEAGEFDPNAIICGVRVQDLDQSTVTPGVDDYVLGCDLRASDPNFPEYADLTGAGLLALADANSLMSCSSTAAHTTRTFGGGAGVPDPLTRLFLTTPQPANNDPQEGIDFCGITLNASGVFMNSARTQSYTAAGGVRTSIGFNHCLEAIVFEPIPHDLHLRVTGSSRFPGDRGLPVQFARRRCLETAPECLVDGSDPGPGDRGDDRITARIAIDNITTSPRTLDLALEVDRRVINPKLGPRDVLAFFRPIGGGPAVMSPLTLGVGRHVLELEIPRLIPRRFLGALPANFSFFSRLIDPNDPNLVEDAEAQALGLRPQAGYYDDDDHAGGFFFTQSPVLTGDALAVRFDAVDLPKPGNTLVVSGIQVAAGEFGASGLPGLDAVDLRREDAVLARNPDLSPQGLFRARGTVGDPGNADGIPTGLPVTTVLVDLTDYITTPSDPALADNLFALAYLNPGDTGSSTTAIGSAGAGDVFIGNSSTMFAGSLPVTGFGQDDLEIRLDVDGALSTSAERDRRTKRLDPLPPLRIPGGVQIVEKGGRVVE
jgi:hypothetical protein